MLKKIEKAIIGATFMFPGAFFLGGSIWLMLTHEGNPAGILLSTIMAFLFWKIGLEEIKVLFKD